MIMARSSTTNHCASSTCRRILSGSAIRWMTLHLGALGLSTPWRWQCPEECGGRCVVVLWLFSRNELDPEEELGHSASFSFRTAYRGCSAGKHRRASVAGAQVGTGGASKLEHSVSAPFRHGGGEWWANGKSYNNIRKMLGYMLRIAEIYIYISHEWNETGGKS